jgi:hypothetical protein
MKLAALWLAATVLALAPRVAGAHAFSPGLIDLRDLGDGNVEVSLKTGSGSDALSVQLPTGCVALAPPRAVPSNGVTLRKYVARCPGLAGQRVGVSGVGAAGTVLVHVVLSDGQATTLVVRADDPAFLVPTSTGVWSTLGSYVRLGIEHIFTGIDHLLFVLGLILLVPGRRRLLATLTAFTVAHSITLSLAALELVAIPPAPVEAAIAVSILWLAVELARDQKTFAVKYPPVMAFAFGLLHGLGFAGALSEVGLPSGEIPAALLGFNAGVELGQITFVIAVLALTFAVRRLLVLLAKLFAMRLFLVDRLWLIGRSVAVYVIGSLAAMWSYERVLAFFGPLG